MFTGIITDIGTIISLQKQDGEDTRLQIKTNYNTSKIAIGASIACDGVCLTVTEKTNDSFFVYASGETIGCTNLAFKKQGDNLNLERALALGEELGGHLVSGHVDGLAEIISIEKEDSSRRILIKAPENLAYYIAVKGSVTINGVSLTVNEVDGVNFGVNIISHTLEKTTLNQLETGSKVNLEIDLLARYIARMAEKPCN